VDLAGELRRIYNALTEECTVDDFATNASLLPGRVASGLAELEMEGLVKASNGPCRRS
jgi:predicted Rossmann fold nucleotide-binding protein DprA/Smf involved in DNA uptake